MTNTSSQPQSNGKQPELTEAQRAKLAQRLAQRDGGNDLGEINPEVAQALMIPDEQARLSALGKALVGTRLLVPVQPHGHDESENSDISQLLRQQSVGGVKAVVAYTDLKTMQLDFPKLRPVPLPVDKVALAAIATKLPLALNGRKHLFLPYPALEALATGDSWLAPWDDEELRSYFKALLARYSALTGYRLMPSPKGTDLELFVDITQGDKFTNQLQLFVGELQKNAKIAARCGLLEVKPRPVSPM
ncbi:hypothetical protein BK816_05600 [Boudabousia tangfeifanii]|uniref:SseB protein N-terminal domain-containing protein n=1 Tax=Boudabousia tangfeifanii TaxID=1912795 RepID=A0A1D9MKK0_9ACTO|nr:SseB family protein [Boudabousia tangfeifanii]AOZ72834.1 hypothetical protein BK816_05600 [Boudabousia tangfeifanii]